MVIFQRFFNIFFQCIYLYLKKKFTAIAKAMDIDKLTGCTCSIFAHYIVIKYDMFIFITHLSRLQLIIAN